MFRILMLFLSIVIWCGVSNARLLQSQTTTSQRNSLEMRQPALPQSKTAPANKSAPTYSINDVIWWLPENIQTVLVAQGPFKVVAPISEPPENMDPILLVNLSLQAFDFHNIKRGRYSRHLIGHTVSFSVDGSRKFRAPAGLGEMTFEGCQITVFQQGLGPLRQMLIKQMEAEAKKTQEIAGQRVAMFEEKLEEDVWNIFAAIPTPDILICATDEGFVREVLNRMTRKSGNRAVPEGLAEWKYVDQTAKFWAVRHFDKYDAELDPTSPLRKEGLGGGDFRDKEAVGVVFDFDSGRSKVARIRYISGNKDALKLYTDGDQVESYRPTIRELEPGVVELLFSLDNQEVAVVFLMSLMWHLGHGVFL
ncbi:MAG: hypothetical protein AB1631_15190 [Acidobacteriota bacterium]